MNQPKHNRLRLIFLTIGAIIITTIAPGMAIAQLIPTPIDATNLPRQSFLASIDRNGIVPPPNLPAEPTELLTSEVSTLPPEVKTAVLNDVVKRTSKTVAALKILEVEPHQWSDGCLGLGKPDEICTQALVSGWRVVVTDGSRDWTYRTDDTGNAIAKLAEGIALEGREEK